jgi:rubrerythrin
MRLIDADALLEAIKTDVMGGLNYQHFIEKAPTIELKQGEWERIPYSFAGDFRCSCCGTKSHDNYWNYCPNCGANMRGSKNEKDT